MKSKQTYCIIALAALLAIAASAALLVRDYHSEAAGHRAVAMARAQTTLDALVAGLRAHGRMGRFRSERLTYIFDELAQTPDILGVSLQGGDGGVIAKAGDVDLLSYFPVDSVTWAPGVLKLSHSVVLGQGGFGPGAGMGGGRGRMNWDEGWESLPAGPHAVTVAVDTSAMEDEIAGDFLRGILTFAVVVAMALSGAAAALGQVRRRILQTDLLVAKEQATHQEHLTRLGAGLAHETKNPLGIIRGQAQLIADSEVDGESLGRARVIVDEIDRAVGQIDAFLKLARPQPPDKKPVALGPFLKSLEILMADEAMLRKVGISIAETASVVLADEEQLRRALLNIVLNALRASSEGGHIEIVVEEDRETVELLVKDRGCGIAPEDLTHVFEPYFSRFEGGSGLGLALVRQIALAHGWTLDIQSQSGQGTTVQLRGLAKGVADALE